MNESDMPEKSEPEILEELSSAWIQQEMGRDRAEIDKMLKRTISPVEEAEIRGILRKCDWHRTSREDMSRLRELLRQHAYLDV